MTPASSTPSLSPAADKINSQHTQASQPVGRQLMSSPAIRSSVDAIVSEVRAKSALITDAKGPSPDCVKSYDEMMARAAAVRGRGLLYPYISSGVGNGALVELMDGSVKWDMICGIGVHFFGHSEPDLIRAAVEAGVEDTLKHGNLQTSNAAFEFAETLLTEAQKNSRLKHCFVSTSGAMANENAIKVCYQKHAPGATRVLAFQDCFMGRTVTMSQLGDSAAGRVGIPLSTQVDYMPFYNPVLADRMGETRFIDMCLDHLRQYIELPRPARVLHL
ncbi:MAG: aminotransferase class III-fold pyridoxal phosphate-dependent enzyme [Phycisphaeraceae bacterium]|nr:aminotransferase class III-fold pyridoxal phosphate-dependent enzyme [Phycisphaeraceae bacterium]